MPESDTRMARERRVILVSVVKPHLLPADMVIRAQRKRQRSITCLAFFSRRVAREFLTKVPL